MRHALKHLRPLSFVSNECDMAAHIQCKQICEPPLKLLHQYI